MTELERQHRPLLKPVLSGYLRPWMSLSEGPKIGGKAERYENMRVWVDRDKDI